MAPNGIPHLQLPALTPLEPLTSGTNLPHVPAEELTPIEESKPPPTPTTTLDASTTPPQSPERPTSMRRFLSRVSLNSSYTHNGDEDDKASILSNPLSPTASVMSRDSKRKPTSSKKSSWWKKSKKEDKIQEKNILPLAPPPHVTTPPKVAPNHFDARSIEVSPPQVTVRKTVQSIAPPPRLPDDLFGNGFSSLDSDMFKNFK